MAPQAAAQVKAEYVKGTGAGGAVRSAEKAGRAPDGAGCDWLESG